MVLNPGSSSSLSYFADRTALAEPVWGARGHLGLPVETCKRERIPQSKIWRSPAD